MSKRNPPWQRDELILALELYVRHQGRSLSETHEDVVALSELLNALPIHAELRTNGYRNPNGVSMKLLNFRRFDPEQRGVGLTRGNKLEEAIWSEYAHDPARLRAVVSAIIAGHRLALHDPLPEPDEEEFPEGRVLFRLHRIKERNPAVIEKVKSIALARAGRLECCVCQFCFRDRYGPLGEGYIEGHHTKPVSELGQDAVTKVGEIALVCPNCHRMLHRRRPWLTVDELGKLLIRTVGDVG